MSKSSVVLSDLNLLKRFGSDLNGRVRLPGNDITQVPPQYRDRLISALLMVRSKDRGLILLQPNRAQQEYSRTCTKRNIVLKARQLGITTYVAARFFIQTITQPGSMTVQVAHNQESAEEIFKIVHRFWENLRDGTREGALMTSHDNVHQMVFPRLDSEYRVASAADLNAGRGLTIHNLHCSEVARWPRSGIEALTSLRAAVPPDGDIVLESTPNGAGGVFYEEWQNADETGYTRHFFPWWYDDHYVVDPGRIALYPLTPDEEELKTRAGLRDDQIAWRRINRAQLRGLAAQEYAEDPISCFRASGECVFDLDVLDRILDATSEPVEMKDNRRLMIWLPPQPGKRYIIGVDPAGGGTDGDYSCAEVIDSRTAMQCAELHGHFPPGDLADRLVNLGRRYNNALLVVERNNHGHAVLGRLQGLAYPKIYADRKGAGWLTSAASRPAMIENLAAVLAAEPLLFRSPRLLRECRTFVRHADGRSEAASGAHDDCVMAMAIALAARQVEVGKVWHEPVDLISLPAISEHP